MDFDTLPTYLPALISCLTSSRKPKKLHRERRYHAIQDYLSFHILPFGIVS
ncbi:hypothetical protein BRARA_G01545 [Brassica rapa]|uniref:Uncharacterized protein n=1 Tax=Brassica campestris TaxID=3711 RepID=A0A397YLB5_BRACM|nr:hypothetical protein BRARA_G01545 [Brassica rapa]